MHSECLQAVRVCKDSSCWVCEIGEWVSSCPNPGKWMIFNTGYLYGLPKENILLGWRQCMKCGYLLKHLCSKVTEWR